MKRFCIVNEDISPGHGEMEDTTGLLASFADARLTLEGIFSYGIKSWDRGGTAVFTRIDRSVEWIRDQIKGGGC